MFKEIKNTGIEISTSGVLRNKQSKREYKTKISKGYEICSHHLHSSYGLPSYLIHRLVFFTHNDLEYDSEMQIDHINRNKLDNSIENLRMLDASSNCLNKETYSTKIMYNKEKDILIITDNIMKFAREYDLDNSRLYDVINGKTKQHKGWTGKQIDFSYDKLDFVEPAPTDFLRYKEELISNYTKSKLNIIDKDAIIEACFDSNVYYFKYSERKTFCEERNLDYRRISDCVRGRMNTHKGYSFKICDNTINT